MLLSLQSSGFKEIVASLEIRDEVPSEEQSTHPEVKLLLLFFAEGVLYCMYQKQMKIVLFSKLNSLIQNRLGGDCFLWIDHVQISAIKTLIDVFWHWVDRCVKLLFHHHHILLILLCYQIYGQSDLTETPTTADSVQISRRIFWEIKIYDNIHTWHINTSRNKVGTDQSFELSLSEPFKDLQPFIFHIGCQIFIFEPFAFHLFRQKLRPFVRSTKNNALVDNKLTVDFVQILQLL